MRKHTEATLQQHIAHYLDSKGILYTSSLMGVNLGARVGAIRKRMGCKPGTPDIFIFHACQGYHGLGIELKVRTSASTEQEDWKRRLEQNGYKSIIVPSKLDLWEAFRWTTQQIDKYMEGK